MGMPKDNDLAFVRHMVAATRSSWMFTIDPSDSSP